MPKCWRLSGCAANQSALRGTARLLNDSLRRQVQVSRVTCGPVSKYCPVPGTRTQRPRRSVEIVCNNSRLLAFVHGARPFHSPIEHVESETLSGKLANSKAEKQAPGPGFRPLAQTACQRAPTVVDSEEPAGAAVSFAPHRPASGPEVGSGRLSPPGRVSETRVGSGTRVGPSQPAWPRFGGPLAMRAMQASGRGRGAGC